MSMLFVLFGLTFTSFMIEFLSISPGGLIVPVFLSAYLLKPKAIVGTFSVASVSFVILFLLNKYFLIQKKRRFILTIAVSTVLVFFWRKYLPFFFPSNMLFETVGWIIPGILSYTMQKNGYFRTMFFSILVAFVLFLIRFVVVFFFNI